MENNYDDAVTLCVTIHELICAEELHNQILEKIGTKVDFCGERIITEVEHAPGSNFIYVTARKAKQNTIK